MISLNHILRIFIGSHKLSKLQDKINQLMYMDDIQLFTKNEERMETLIQAMIIYYQDREMEFGREKFTTLIMKSGKRHLTE